MALYLIDGISGTGKTTLAEELIKKGYTAIDADKAFGFFGNPETGNPTHEKIQANWIWDLDKVKALADASADKAVYVCGGAMNQNKAKDLFTKRFTLVVDDDTLKHRLLSRTNNDFGKHPDELAKQLEWNQGIIAYANSTGSIVIDATKPIDEVAKAILKETESAH